MNDTNIPNVTPKDIFNHLKILLSIPAYYDYANYPPTIAYAPVNDPCTLSCGCIISRNLIDTLKIQMKNGLSNANKTTPFTNGNPFDNDSVFKCPLCEKADTKIIGNATNMKNLYIYWTKLGDELRIFKNSDGIGSTNITTPTDRDISDISSMFSKLSSEKQRKNSFQGKHLQQTHSNKKPFKQIQSQPQNFSFLTAFNEALIEVENSSSVESNETKRLSIIPSNHSPRDNHFEELHNNNSYNTQDHVQSPTDTSVISSLGSLHKQRTKHSYQNSSNLTRLLSTSSSGNNIPASHTINNSLGSSENGMFSRTSTQNLGVKNSNQTNNENETQNKKVNGFNSTANNSDDVISKKFSFEKSNLRNKELLLSKNFPFFRKTYNFNLHSNNILLKTKLYIQTGISPNITKLVLLNEKKWEVYSIDTDTPNKAPTLLCCGKSDASYGPDFDHLKKMKKEHILLNSNFNVYSDNNSKNATTNTSYFSSLENWEHLYCRLSENLLIISGTKGFLRIIDLNQNGRCVFTYKCNFPIRCLDLSPNEEYVALGITGKDKYTEMEQSVIILLKLIPETLKSSFQIITLPFSLPYRDPIGILKFSSDSSLLSVATVLESRFLVISLVDPSKPTLVMKSQRRLDTSLDSEGITDICFFPDNRIMSITSSSHNSEPIIIDSNIDSISGPDGIAKPKLLLKIDEVGSTIHKCCVSPRGDSVVFLNRRGNVYIMTTPRMDDNDNKHVVNVFDVSGASRVKESASIRFDVDGYKLYALDRKGILSIADFTAGTVEDHTVTRCKIIA
ncbi:Ptr3 protein [Pichia kluyveri]|uniref:Ptr3 protein n=1 Tax=Pichia kluyveri TaxID=36015 RepID=A0AAV5R7Y2_PICKL|nr:Ptr3 protein [Pichia kluyveri]